VIADRMYRRENIDIIYQVASGSGMGVFNAANDNYKYAIGVDSEQDHIIPGSILTSVIKRFDMSILRIVEDCINGKFENMNHSLGLKEEAVMLSEMNYTKDFIKSSTLNKLENIKQQIIDKQITVPSTY
jgi:basic membrane protein A